jgi:hypothetical protein
MILVTAADRWVPRPHACSPSDPPALLGRPARIFEQFTTDYAQAFS